MVVPADGFGQDVDNSDVAVGGDDVETRGSVTVTVTVLVDVETTSEYAVGKAMIPVWSDSLWSSMYPHGTVKLEVQSETLAPQTHSVSVPSH